MCKGAEAARASGVAFVSAEVSAWLDKKQTPVRRQDYEDMRQKQTEFTTGPEGRGKCR